MPELPRSSGPAGVCQTADTDAMICATGRRRRGNIGTHGTQRVGCCQHVLRFEQTVHSGFTDAERSQDQGAVRNRFVAGYANASGQRTATAGAQRMGRLRVQSITPVLGAVGSEAVS